MRLLRQLASNVWYNVDTEINNKEPLFGVQGNVDLFMQVLFEAYVLFAFELRGLKFNGAQVLFFIKPADGLKLPAVMQWIKQTFAVRFDQNHRRTGHIWGDRYGSEILPGEPPPDAEVCVFGVAVRCANRRARRAQRKRGLGKIAAAGQSAKSVGVCPRLRKLAEPPCFPPGSPRLAAPVSGPVP